jgi:hypothetical protein
MHAVHGIQEYSPTRVVAQASSSNLSTTASKINSSFEWAAQKHLT